jgi:hypothetical protein
MQPEQPLTAGPPRLLYDGNRKGPRHCGDCQLCCKLLPVRALKKRANERCKHQKAGKGCAVYGDAAKGFPAECHFWSCRWLLHEPGTETMRRPDRVHYCLDIMPDYVTLVNNATGARTEVEVVQVWCDAGYPDAHRDPGLRAFLQAKRMPALVRYSEREALHLFPPSCSEDGQWHEAGGDLREPPHTPGQVAKALGLQTKIT